MWQWLLAPIFLLCNPLCSLCYGVSTSSGPTSEEEAAVLWKTGETALAESRFQDAVNALQRYIDRYPGHLHYLKAQLDLGTALLEQNENGPAASALKSFIFTSRNPTEAAKGRLLLGRVYLNQKKFEQAHLISLEISRIGHDKHLPLEILLESSLIQSEALLGLGHLDRAIQMLHQIEQQFSESQPSRIKGQLYGLEIKLKISDCARLPTDDPMDEAQLRGQLDRRGSCFLESLLIYRKILQANDGKSASLATSQVIQSFSQYANACSSQRPPPSPPIRSPQELKKYHTELTDRLQQDCKQKWSTAADLLSSWKTNLSPTMLQFLLQSENHIGNFLSSRTP